MSKKTYLLILLLIIVATYLTYTVAFKKSSQIIPTSNPPQTQAKLPVYQATLTLSPNPLVISPQLQQASGSVDVIMDTASQKTSAVQLELAYDPKVLTNVSIVPGTFLKNSIELLKTIDATNGRISYALGITPGSEQAQGQGKVATITFTANTGLVKSTQISFLPKTLATQQGLQTSILKSETGTTILFQIPTTTPAGQTSTPSAQ